MALPQEYQDEVRRIVREEMNQPKTHTASHVSYLNDNLREANLTIQRLATERDDLAKTNAGIEKHLRERINALIRERDEAANTAHRLSKEQEQLRTENGRLAGRVSGLAAENNKAQNDLYDRNEEVKQLAGKCAQQSHEIQGLRQAPEVLKTELNALIQQIAAQRDEEKQRADDNFKDFKRVRELNQTQGREIQALKDALERARQDKEALQTQLTNQKTEAAREVNRVAQQRDHWIKKFNTYADRLSATQKERDELKEELRRTTEERDQLQKNSTDASIAMDRILSQAVAYINGETIAKEPS